MAKATTLGKQRWRSLDAAAAVRHLGWPRTIERLAKTLDKFVANLGASEWHSLHSSLRRAVGFNSLRSWIKPLGIRVSELPSSISDRTVALLAARCTSANADELFERYLIDYRGNDLAVVSLCTDVQVSRALGDDMKVAPRLLRV